MPLDIKTIATANLAVQVFLIILISFAAFLAKKKQTQSHCAIIRIAVIIQTGAIASVMLPSLLGYIKISGLSNYEIIFHHALGSLLIIIWIYINLVYVKILRWPANFKYVMRSAYLLWLLVFILGVHIYTRVYL